jgi:hypothetical protein
VAEISAHALLALEPLIHPRCLPPVGAASVGLAPGRATGTGNLTSQVQRPGKHNTSAGPVSAVPTAAPNLAYAGAITPPVLKLGQAAMDPWAEVDTWVGCGEGFEEEGGLFYEELVDELNVGTDEAIRSSGAGNLGSKQQNADDGGTEGVDKSFRDGGNFVAAFDDTKLANFNGEHILSRNAETHGGDLPLHTLEQDAHKEQITEVSGALGGAAPSLPMTSRDDNSQLEGLGYSKDGFLVNKTDSINVSAGDMLPGDKNIDNNYMDIHRAARYARPKTPAMGPFSFENIAVEIGSESDSDGVLPDIIDGDPDSD